MDEILRASRLSLIQLLNSASSKEKIDFLYKNFDHTRIQAIRYCYVTPEEKRAYKFCTTNSEEVRKKLDFTEEEILNILTLNPSLIVKISNPTEEMIENLQRLDAPVSVDLKNYIINNFSLFREYEDVLAYLIANCEGDRLAIHLKTEKYQFNKSNQERILNLQNGNISYTSLYNINKDLQLETWKNVGLTHGFEETFKLINYFEQNSTHENIHEVISCISKLLNHNSAIIYGYSKLPETEVEELFIDFISKGYVTVDQSRKMGVNISVSQELLTQL